MVLCLIDIRKDRSSDYERRLLFKYIIIELRSIIEQLEKLQGIIFTSVRGNLEKSIRIGQITNQEAEEMLDLVTAQIIPQYESRLFMGVEITRANIFQKLREMCRNDGFNATEFNTWLGEYLQHFLTPLK